MPHSIVVKMKLNMKMKPLPDRKLLMIVAVFVIGTVGQKRNNLYLVAEIRKVVLEMGFEE